MLVNNCSIISVFILCVLALPVQADENNEDISVGGDIPWPLIQKFQSSHDEVLQRLFIEDPSIEQCYTKCFKKCDMQELFGKIKCHNKCTQECI